MHAGMARHLTAAEPSSAVCTLAGRTGLRCWPEVRTLTGDRVCRLTGVDWRQKIENQRGAVLATELKNNANKLAKWTATALVAGVDTIKLGYVARAHPRDPRHHVILSTQVPPAATACSHQRCASGHAVPPQLYHRPMFQHDSIMRETSGGP